MNRKKAAMRPFPASVLSIVAWLALMPAVAAQNAAPGGELIDPKDIPSVHNTLYKVPDGVVSWDVLGTMDIQVEVLGPLQARSTETFTDSVRALDGDTIKVMGFLYPLEGGVGHEHFLLTAWPPSCPFCLPAGPTMMVETFAAEPIDFTEGAIVMAGRFELLENDPSGFFYRMQDAELVERFDDIRWPSGSEALQPGLQ
ncbi:MAG: hypothetical protein R3F54_12540 [Alphaproteobacteria bacterium]